GVGVTSHGRTEHTIRKPPLCRADGSRERETIEPASGVFGSALAELRRTARLVPPVLLPLDFARIAREQTVIAQHLVEVLVLRPERARQAEAHGAGLAGDAAAVDVARDVVVVAGLGDRQRHQCLPPRVVRDEELLDLDTVDHELAGASLDAHAGSRRL